MTARRLPRSVAKLTELVQSLKRELESAEDRLDSNHEELARLRHLVANPDFNLPAALAIVKERDEWKTNYELAQRKLSELEGRPGEPTSPDRRTWWDEVTDFVAQCLRW